MLRVYSYSVVVRVVEVLRPRMYRLFSCRVAASHLVCTAYQLSCFGFFLLVQLHQAVLEGSLYSSIVVLLSVAVLFSDTSCNPVVIIYIYIYMGASD